MTYKPVPLVRYFSQVLASEDDSDEQELCSILSDRNHASWQELEEEFRCVILAEAGAGKSFEMEARAKRSEGLGRTAFFIRIEDINEDFETAFEVGSVGTFESWLNSREEAWFFLDSIDEARLENPRAFEKAIKRFAARIEPAKQRARVFISSRPYAWRARSDRDLLERYLPFKKLKSEQVGNRERVSEKIDIDESVESESALKVYLLEPLDEEGIRTFANHRETPQVDELISNLERANLISMAARPFDLESILEKWKTDQTLEGRLELLQHNIDLRLKEINPDRAQRQRLNREKARHGARLLAAAVILTGEPGIRIPDSTLHNRGIDAETVLGDWNPAEVQALLERGIFNDVLYGLVRFRHREVRELLAAEWFSYQLGNSYSRHAMEVLFIREQYGHLIITPRLRPVLPWLVLFDDDIRYKVLAVAPEIAVEGGDAARLPFVERRAILHDIARRIAQGEDDRSARDNSAIARIAQPDLADDALQLIAAYYDNDEAIFFLGRLVWQGEMMACLPGLSDIAGDPDAGIYARIAATRAVMACGVRSQKDRLWNRMVTSPGNLQRRLLAEVIENADSDVTSVNLLLVSIEKLEDYERYEMTGLGQALHGFMDRFPIYNAIGVSEPLVVLVGGFNNYLDREPYIERGDCHVSKEFAWLLGPAVHAVERLVAAQSVAALTPEALSIMLKLPVARFWSERDLEEYHNSLQELVPAWKELNDTLFWRSVEEARNRLEIRKSDRLIDDWPVQWMGHCWNFEADRFEDVLCFIAACDFLDDKLVALSLAHRLYLKAGKPDGWLNELERVAEGNSALEGRLDILLNPAVSQSDMEWEEMEARREEERRKKEKQRDRNRAKWVERLKEMPAVVRRPPRLKPGEFSYDQYWLLGEVSGAGFRTSRSYGANWKALLPEFGEKVARAYRDAAIMHWRSFMPGLRSEGCDTSSMPYALIFAMAGLEIEASETDNFPKNLTEAEVRHAVRYAVWELNGFPSWLEKLHKAFPDIVLESILAELRWELSHAESDQNVRYILHDLTHCASWLHKFVAPYLSAWVEQNEISNDDVLRCCIHIMLNGNINTEAISKLAQSKIENGAADESLAAWYALWVDLDANHGIPATSKWLLSMPPEEASKEAQLFITRLMGTWRFSDTGYGRGDFRSVKHLKTLYVLMHRYIRARDDIDRAGKGVYSPGLRDHAQDGRDALLNQLSEIPGKETYVALVELSRDHPDVNYQRWMQKLAYRRAEEDANLEPWTAQQVRDYAQYQVRTPTTHRQLFDLTVDHLNDLKDWIERSNNSPYKTWQRADSETEMRNLVAGWLNSRSSGRYTCAQENEFPNRQRPDIWIQSPQVDSALPIELKVLDKGWSGPELCERLRNQLVGDYLRETTASCGVMLLIWKGQSTQSQWQIGDRRAALKDLEEALECYWRTIANNFTGVIAIDVILIDLTIRDAKSKG